MRGWILVQNIFNSMFCLGKQGIKHVRKLYRKLAIMVSNQDAYNFIYTIGVSSVSWKSCNLGCHLWKL